MYFVTPESITTRQAALDGFHKASLALFETTHEYSRTLFEVSQKTISRRLEHVQRLADGEAGSGLIDYVQAIWSDEAKEDALRLVKHQVEAVNAAHGTLTDLVENNVSHFRGYMTALVDRIGNLTPPEGAIALNAVKSAVSAASDTLNSLAAVSHQVVESAEKDIEEIAEEASASPAKARSRKPAAN